MDAKDIHCESNTPLRWLQPERLGEGEHIIWTSPEAVRVSIEVHDGKVTRWHAIDGDGRPVKMSFRKARRNEDVQQAPSVLAEDVLLPPPPRPRVEVCYACYSNPLPTGPRIICYEIPCYF